MFATAAGFLKSSHRTTAFTGAGISVESGIQPFRGENGLWNKYDPETFDIRYFLSHPGESWQVIRDIFYDLFGTVKPNAAHYALAELESRGLLNTVITQNVDSLHRDAGSRTVHEFHGSLRKLVCLSCSARVKIEAVSLDSLPPLCSRCSGLLKPDAVFFGEPIPEPAQSKSFGEADRSDLFILVGTTGEVAPANMIPRMAKQNGARIIEVNTEKSAYTDTITDVFLQGSATVVMEALLEELEK
ncbi:MAG TPA: NAD-dependent deacylase [Desulfobacteraceae bacterium]|nr:NAD-dependent deacylase [Desulfobacteraceae bacterium]